MVEKSSSIVNLYQRLWSDVYIPRIGRENESRADICSPRQHALGNPGISSCRLAAPAIKLVIFDTT